MNEPSDPREEEISQLLIAWREGDREALNRLFPLVYSTLRELARRQLRRSAPDQTLRTTALVHEAYLKLAGHGSARVQDRGHFYAMASRAMRQILVDDARRRISDKRGGGAPVETMDPDIAAGAAPDPDLLVINEALERLEALDERLGRIVELRFFGGLSVEETAEALASSARTVKRDWQKARAFLYRELHGEGRP